ncbi:MAG: response regulator [SAR324 cluster bacterium]|nr:response regulator [SAR324 cluster bacterium]
MDSILLISQDRQTHKWIKEFSERKFEPQFSFNAKETVEKLSAPVDLLLFDADQKQMEITEFMDELENHFWYLPVLILTSHPEKSDELAMISPEIVGHLPKPFSQVAFQDTVETVIEKYRKSRRKELSLGKNMQHFEESQFLLGYRSPATIYKVSQHGMVFFLPTAVANGTRILFKGKPLYNKLGLETEEASSRVEIRSSKCLITSDHRFKVTAHFTKNTDPVSKEKLDRYVEKHAGKYSKLSKKQTLVVGGDNDSVWQTYKFYLKDSGFRLFFAHNGEEVLERLKQAPVDILVLDSSNLKAHVNDILDQMEALKIRIPVIVVTEVQEPKIIQKIAPKVKELLIKPYNAKMLLERIHKALDRWENELRTQEEIGENIGLYFNTRVLLAFQESIIVDRVRKDGLLFYTHEPIVPTSSIYFNARSLFQTIAGVNSNVGPLELEVIYCERVDDIRPYRVFAEFRNLLSFQLVIDAFVDGKPIPEIDDQSFNETDAEDILDDFIDDFDSDFSIEESV